MTDEIETPQEPLPETGAVPAVVEASALDPIAESAANLAKMKLAVAEAEKAHAEVVKAHTPPDPTPELGKHILVDINGSGTYGLMDAPKGYDGDNPDRSLNLLGIGIVEHVDTDPSGIWCYRKM